MTMEPAARVADEIAHGYGMLAMVGGALVGVAAGIAVVGVMTITGGLAAVVIAGAVAGGGLAGDQIASGLETIFDLPEPTTGVLAVGSPNVFVNGRAAIRAELSSAAGCSGAPFNHFPMSGAVIVREGSGSVSINGQPASRLKSMLMCGAHIRTASHDVLIGGPTVQTGFIFDLEGWTRSGLQILGIGAAVGAGVFAAMAGAAAFGSFLGIGALGFAGIEGVGMIGDAIGPGYRDLLQGLVGMGMVVSAPKLARMNASPAMYEQSRRTGIPAGKLQSVLEAPKGSRPDPSTYMSKRQIDTHLAEFDEGASRLMLKSNLEKYGPGREDGTSFVMTKGQADKMLQEAGGSTAKLEDALGLPRGQLDGDELVRVDFPNPRDLGVRVPSGNEAGANSQWLPGGKLPDGALEAVVETSKLRPGDMITTTVAGP
jgi:uncharacterized Zn-binding protein involved in type VI secretion